MGAQAVPAAVGNDAAPVFGDDMRAGTAAFLLGAYAGRNAPKNKKEQPKPFAQSIQNAGMKPEAVYPLDRRKAEAIPASDPLIYMNARQSPKRRCALDQRTVNPFSQRSAYLYERRAKPEAVMRIGSKNDVSHSHNDPLIYVKLWG